MVSAVELGREAFARREWGDARAHLAAGEDLDVEDLERLAIAAYLVGRDAESHEAWQRAQLECERLGERDRGARCAFWLGLSLVLRGEMAQGSGWLARAERLLAENHAGAAPWYRLAYKTITEETPYTFPKVAQLTRSADLPASCKPNRGPERAPLFLMNHWISTDPTPKPSDAAKVNAYAPLLARARECRRIRDHIPNLLAVNFYLEGDVFRVVDTLNGVR